MMKTAPMTHSCRIDAHVDLAVDEALVDGLLDEDGHGQPAAGADEREDDRQPGAVAQLGAGPPAPPTVSAAPHSGVPSPPTGVASLAPESAAGAGVVAQARWSVAGVLSVGLVGGPVPLVGLDQVAVARDAGQQLLVAARGRRPGRRPGRPPRRPARWSTGRLATTTVVMPVRRAPRPVRIRASVVGSRLEVASSRSRTAGRRSERRARATRWRWPPERVTPRSPTTVSTPCGQLGDERRRPGPGRAPSAARSSRGRPEDVDVAAQRCRRTGTAPGRRAPGRGVAAATSPASGTNRPASTARSVDLPDAGRADDGHRRPRGMSRSTSCRTSRPGS